MQRKDMTKIFCNEVIPFSDEENSKVDDEINSKGEQIERQFRYLNGVSDYSSRRTYVWKSE